MLKSELVNEATVVYTITTVKHAEGELVNEATVCTIPTVTSNLKNKKSLSLQQRLEVLKYINDCQTAPDPEDIKNFANAFKCSQSHILEIIRDRELYVTNRPLAREQSNQQNQIKFLGECVYEHVQRKNYYENIPITKQEIMLSALNFQDIMKIEGFTPDQRWFFSFKTAYNISFCNPKLELKHIPENSLDFKDIIKFCKAKNYRNDMDLLQKPLMEYIRRIKMHDNAVDDIALLHVAFELNEILNVENFEPTLDWINDIRKLQTKEDENSANVKCQTLLSLNLRDIISYCNANEREAKTEFSANPVKESSDSSTSKFNLSSHFDPENIDKPLECNVNKETALNQLNSSEIYHPNSDGLKVQNESVLCLDGHTQRENKVRRTCKLAKRELNFRERIEVIKAYHKHQSYKKVAQMFKCNTWDIRKIIKYSHNHVEYYKQKKKHLDKEETELFLRLSKLKLLEDCVRENVLRLHCYSKLCITEEMIKAKALEFNNIIKLKDYCPRKMLLNRIKLNYFDKKRSINRTPPPPLFDLKSILEYCTKLQATKTKNRQIQNNTRLVPSSEEKDNLRKLDLLQRVLCEYVLRGKCHHRTIQLDDAALQQAALDFNKELKIPYFEPTLSWIEAFRKRQERYEKLRNIKPVPLLSLDFKDIIGYCTTTTLASEESVLTKHSNLSKFQQNFILYSEESEEDVEEDIKPVSINLISKEKILPIDPIHSNPLLKFQQKPILYLEESEEVDFKADVDEQKMKTFKVNKTESITNDQEFHYHFQHFVKKKSIIPSKKRPTFSLKKNLQESHKDLVRTMFLNKSIDKPEEVFGKQQTIINNFDSKEDNALSILATNFRTTSTAISQKQDPKNAAISQQNYNHHHLPEENNIDSPGHATSSKDILVLLKHLNQYAMQTDNSRAVGLIAQLEEHLEKYA